MNLRFYLAALVAAVILASCSGPPRRGPVVYAASSLQEPLEALAAQWVAEGGDPPVFSFASSAALARQIEQGAPADIFISADEQWTDYIVVAGKLPRDAVRSIAANSLVVATSIRNRSLGPTGPEAARSALVAARHVAGGDPETVPLGRYARQSLEQAGLWDGMRPRWIGAPSSASALKLVLIGEAEVGILYASDAARRDDLGIIHHLSRDSHARIVYRALLLPGSAHPDAAEFLNVLSGDDAKRVFREHGFPNP
ncbi:MAG: molybdate ABC transporter substrate-binding protein [Pontixanthobacter sp.]